MSKDIGTLLAIIEERIKFYIKGFFSKRSRIHGKLPIWWHLLKKSLIENFIFLCSAFTKALPKNYSEKFGKFQWESYATATVAI